MREIKFRAWWKDTLEPIPDFNEEYTIDACNQDPQGDDVFIVCQFTGLKDKNGKEIYEGDIVIVDDDLFMSPHTPYEVKFGTGTFDSGVYEFVGWHCGRDHSAQDTLLDQDVKVIGNIYENPELLKGGSHG